MHTSAKFCIIPLSLALLLVLAGCSSGHIDVAPVDEARTSGGSISAILSWSTPTLYTDDTPVAPGDIKEYRVYVRTSSGSYAPSPIKIQTTSVPVKDIVTTGTGTYYFVVTAVDLTDVEGDFSKEVSVVIE